MAKTIDLRSDTVTKPTEEMIQAMHSAEVGDDVYGEDPTINQLEKLAADKVGMEAAVFVPSGTMGNQISVMAHTERGDEVVMESESHIYYYEVGGLAVLSGIQPYLVQGEHGILNSEKIERGLRTKNIHFPRTSLICLENSSNRGGGTVYPLQNLADIQALATARGLKIHMDGARVFNAAVALDVDVKEITKYVDSIMFCLSKGLCAPVGSMVAGKKEWVDKARKWRKMLGGGMRQAGIIAAAGIVSLEKMVDRLAEDHENARMLAQGLAALPGIHVDMDTIQTNIVAFSIADTPYSPAELCMKLKEQSVLANPIDATRIRMVTHHGITADDIQSTLSAIHDLVS